MAQAMPKLEPVGHDPFRFAHVAALGRGQDRYLAHMSAGDTVIPVELVTPRVKLVLQAILGHQYEQFVVASGRNRVNPKTHLFEFEDGGDGGDGGGGGGDTGGGGAAGEGGAGGPGDPAGSPDSGAGGASTGTGGTDTSGTDTSSGGGTKSSTAADESAGFTGISASDYTGPSTSGKSIAGALGLTSTETGIATSAIGMIGSMLGVPGLGMGLSAVNAMSAHGVDDPSNPGGNISSGAIGGVGMGMGATSSPGGANVGGVGSSPGGPGGANALGLSPATVNQLLPRPSTGMYGN